MLNEAKILLKEEKYQEAYDIFSKHYQKYKDVESYFYMTNIDYFNFKDKSLNEYYNMYLKLKKLAPKKMILSFIHPLVAIAYDLKDYKNVIKYIEEALKFNLNDPFLFSIMASSYLEIFLYDKAIYYADKALSSDVSDERIKGASYETKAFAYAFKHDASNALKIINDMYLTLENQELVEFSELKIYLYLDMEEKAIAIVDKLIETKNNPVDFILELEIYLESKQKYMLVIKYLNILISKYLGYFDEPFYLYYNMIRILNLNKEYEKAISYLKNIDLNIISKENKLILNEELAYAYYNINNVFNAVNCYIECFDITNDKEYIKLIAKILYEAKEYDKALKYLNDYNVNDSLFLTGMIEKEKGNFDLAEKLMILGKKETNLKKFSFAIINVSKNPKKYFRLLNKSYKLTNDSLVYRFLSSNLFHGEYNNKVNEKKALEYALMSIKLDKNNICAYSMLGNIYLAKEKYDEAFKIFEMGYELYLRNKECSCIVGFYCYCLKNGLGTNKDELKAYNILNELFINEYDKMSENCFAIFVDLSIIFKKDLNIILDKLYHYYERRYSLTKYYLICKIKKILNLNYDDDYKIFKKCLKFVSKKERKHYKNNNETYYLNNF